YQAMGRRLAERGALSSRDHVFFAAKTEIYDHLAGKLPAERLKARADWRRAWWNRMKGFEPAAFLKGNLPYQPDRPARELGEGDLGGVGGAPGIAEGPVRLIRTLAELGSVEEGEILSHATVLGREYGLPVVIGAAGAAAAFREGDRVEINGTTGIVRRVTTSGEAETRSVECVEA